MRFWIEVFLDLSHLASFDVNTAVCPIELHHHIAALLCANGTF
jgi:hypothetical protein